MHMDSKLRIGIVGAGPGGLTTALALEQYAPPESVDITLVDRNADISDYPGVEYGLQARAMRAYERLGVADVVRTLGNPVGRYEFYDRRGHRQFLLRVDRDRSIDVLRREFLSEIATLVHAPVLRRHEVTAIDVADDGREMSVAFAGTPDRRTFDLLIAADGVHSAARRLFFPRHAVTYDRGFSIVYLLVDATDVPDGRVPAGFLDAANCDVIRFARGSFATGAWFPAGRRRLTLALGLDHTSRDRLWRRSGVPSRLAWTDMPAETRATVAAHLAVDIQGPQGLMARSLELVNDWTSPDIYLWSMRDSDPLQQPYAAHAPVVLLGDAAHAFLPTIGMGASLAIEDAEMLGQLIARHLQHRDGDLRRDVLVPFGAQRLPVWTDLMHRARAAVTNWKHETTGQGFVLSPFVPTRLGSAVVRGVERIQGRTVLPA